MTSAPSRFSGSGPGWPRARGVRLLPGSRVPPQPSHRAYSRPAVLRHLNVTLRRRSKHREIPSAFFHRSVRPLAVRRICSRCPRRPAAACRNLQAVPKHEALAGNSRPRDVTADPILWGWLHVTIAAARLRSRCQATARGRCCVPFCAPSDKDQGALTGTSGDSAQGVVQTRAPVI